MTLDEHERLIVEQIQHLQRAYQKAAQPWVHQLVSDWDVGDTVSITKERP